MESDNFSSSGLYLLCKEAENRSSGADSPAPEPPLSKIIDSELPPLGAATVGVGGKKRRGRPPKGEKKAAAASVKRRRKKENDEDEDVCFICFDGGILVVCDRGDCPKAYHPACIKRDEAFFRSTTRWTCGWHICSRCQKSVSRYMCYTCTYSLCKGCSYDTDYLCVRDNKGFCSTCYRVVLMIENIDQGNQETVQVDFDDELSWEYLFKIYWISLKQDLSLTVDEITRAQKPSPAHTKVSRREKYSAVCHRGNNGSLTRETPIVPSKGISYTPVKSVCDNNNNTSVATTWASKKLLDFVAYVRNGDTSMLSQREVEVLLFDYIKRENLRDPHERSEIVCDPTLENLLGKRRVHHFEMLSILEFEYHSRDDPIVGLVNVNDSHKVDAKNDESVNVNAGNEGEDSYKNLDRHVDSSGSTNNALKNQACLKSKSLCGARSETSIASLSTGSMPSVNDREAENSWHYRDSSGYVQGPFRIDQFQKWNSTGIFPLDMKIWRLNTEEHDSVPLGDVIKNQIPIQNTEVNGAPNCTPHHCNEPCSAHSDGRLDFDKGNGPITHSSMLEPVIKSDPLINNGARIENSIKCRDPDSNPPKVIKSSTNQLEVYSVGQVSVYTEKPHSVHENKSNVGQKLNPNPNRKSRKFQETMKSPTKGYVSQHSLDGSLCENSSLNDSNSHESHPLCAPMAKLPVYSEQNFRINLQDFPMPIPEASTGALPAQTIKEEQWEPPQVSVQKSDINLQDFPMPMRKTSTVELPAQTIKEQPWWEPAQVFAQNLSIQNMPSLIPKSIDHDEKNNFRNQNKALMNEWDLSFVSVSSFSPNRIENVPITTQTSKCDKLPPPSPPNPVPYASSWLAMVTEPIEFDTSVSDLLAEVDAMESNSDLAPPNLLMDYADDLFHDSKTNIFTSLGELSSPLDREKVNDFNTSEYMMIPPQSTVKKEPIQEINNTIFDPFKRPQKHSNTSSVLGIDAFGSKNDLSQSRKPENTIVEPSKKPRKQSNTSSVLKSDDLASKNNDLNSSRNIMPPPKSNAVPEPLNKPRKYSTSSKPEVETRQFDILANKLNSSPPKKTKDLVDIMNAPPKHENLSSPVPAHRESGHGTPKGSGSKNWSHQKQGGERLLTSPRERNTLSGLSSLRDQNMPGGDVGPTTGRPPWSRHGGDGGGGSGSHSRVVPRGRVCKFYENGYCRKGAFCDYLHP